MSDEAMPLREVLDHVGAALRWENHAKAAIRHRLESGDLIAEALSVRVSAGTIGPAEVHPELTLPATFWKGAAVAWERDYAESVIEVPLETIPEVGTVVRCDRYQAIGVRVNRADVLAFWPEGQSEIARIRQRVADEPASKDATRQPSPPPVYADARIARHLSEWMPRQQPSATREAAFAECKNQFPGSNIRASFDRVWRTLPPELKRKPGQRVVPLRKGGGVSPT